MSDRQVCQNPSPIYYLGILLFLEHFIGRYGKSMLKSSAIQLKRMSDAEFITYLKSSVKFMEVMSIEDVATDLMSIRDDMIGYVNKCIYLAGLA